MRIRPASFLMVLTIFAVHVASPALAVADGNKSIFSDDEPDKRPQGTGPAPTAPRDSSPPPKVPPGAPARATSKLPPGGGAAKPPAARPPAPLPLPSAAAIRESDKLIANLYRDDLANAVTPPRKSELAKKLLAVAGGTRGEPANRYVLFDRARELAAAAGDVETSVAAMDQLAALYVVDDAGLHLPTFAALSKSAAARGELEAVVDAVGQWMDEQVRLDHYDLARKGGEIALNTARRSKDPSLVGAVQLHLRDVAEVEAAYPAAKRALAACEANPADHAASSVAGRFLCFLKGDWERGLRVLDAAKEPALRDPINAELLAPPTANVWVGVADRWWDVAEHEKGLSQRQIRRHAQAWYRAALPDLTGLARAKAEKRLALDDQRSPAAAMAVTLAVKGRQKWQPAVVVKKGETVTVVATGTWTTWRDGGYTCDADGRPDGKWQLEKAYPEGALIGRIGGRVALIGKSATFRATEDGELELRSNKDDAHVHDNDGELQVTITKS